MKLLALLFALFFSLLAEAVPSISGTTGTPAHGNSITINGSGFGSGTNALPVIFDQGQYSDMASSPWTSYSPSALGAPYDMAYSTGVGGVAMPHSRISKYLTGVHLDFDNPSNGVNLDRNRAVPGSYPFYTVMSFYYRVHPNWVFGDDNNFKTYLFTAGPSPFTGCTFYTSFGSTVWDSAATGVGQHGYADEISPEPPFGCGARAMDWPDNNGNGPFIYCWEPGCELFPTQTWIKQEFIARWDDSDVTGWFDLINNGSLARNQEQYDHSYVGITAVLAGGVQSGLVVDSAGGYARNRSANNRRYFADIYLSYGLQRVMLGNATTYAASTVREYQKPTAWTASSITVTVNAGTFANGATAYIYVCDENNSCNSNGTAITIASGGGSPPVANFTCAPLTLQAPASTTCTDSSTNTPTSWSWSGDCGTSTSQNPTLSCTTGGLKDICLIATNGDGSSSQFCRTDYVTSRYRKPTSKPKRYE